MKLLRYFGVGAVAAAVDIGLFGIFARCLGFPWFPVALFSFTLATFVNYFLSVRHVFTSGVRFAPHQEFVLTFAISAVGLALNQGMLWWLIEGFHIDILFSKVLATGTVFFWNFAGRNFFIFREGNSRN
jgi:putative flippase GtrA